MPRISLFGPHRTALRSALAERRSPVLIERAATQIPSLFSRAEAGAPAQTPAASQGEGRPTRQPPPPSKLQRTEAGARCPGLPAPTTSVQTTPPLYPPAYRTSPQGGRSSRSGKRAKWGEVKRVDLSRWAARGEGHTCPRLAKVERVDVLPATQATTIVTGNDPFNLEPTTSLPLTMPSGSHACT